MSDTQFWVTVGVWNLIVFSAFGGLGALLGMVIWHHKTLKIKFKLAIPIALLWSVYAVGFGYGLWVK